MTAAAAAALSPARRSSASCFWGPCPSAASTVLAVSRCDIDMRLFAGLNFPYVSGLSKYSW